MSLPAFSTQSELFSTAGLAASLFTETDRYRLFGKLVYPHLAAARAALAPCYCTEKGSSLNIDTDRIWVSHTEPDELR